MAKTKEEKAVEEAMEIARPKVKDDLSDPRNVTECPDCGLDTLPCLGDSPVECTNCGNSFEVEFCEGGHYATSLTDGRCSDCWDTLKDKWDKE